MPPFTVLTSTPLTALNLSSVEPAHGGIAAAIQNAVGRLSALIATACVGLIAASTLTDASFGRLLQVCAVLFFIAGAVGAIIITNPTVPAEPVHVKSPQCAATATTHTPIWPATSEAAGRLLPCNG